MSQGLTKFAFAEIGMIRLIYKPQYFQKKLEGPLTTVETEGLLWIDLHSPSKEQLRSVEEKFKITFPTLQDQAEIEASSRYMEEGEAICINSTFLLQNQGNEEMQAYGITFILTDHHLFSLRYFDSKTIAEVVRKTKQNLQLYSTPASLLITILETRIDLDADQIESISRNIASLGSGIHNSKELDESIIHNINRYQGQIMALRETLFDKQRVISLLIRNQKVHQNHSEILRVILKDIASLIEHTNFNFTRLEYMQNNFIGLVNIEQNKIIKIFTVASVIFMPPTLIASLYGMNFRLMPELEWPLGYPFALLLMALSSIITLYFFKKKKWL